MNDEIIFFPTTINIIIVIIDNNRFVTVNIIDTIMIV